MRETKRRPFEQHLWKLPAFALVAPLVASALTIVLNMLGATFYAHRVFDVFMRLGYLAPGLGLLTLFILATQYSMFWSEMDFGRIGPRWIAVLAVMAIVSPVWLFVLYWLSGGGR